MSEEGDDRDITLTWGEIKDTDNRIKALEKGETTTMELRNKQQNQIAELKNQIKEINKILVVITEGRVLELNSITNLELVLRGLYKKLQKKNIINAYFMEEQLEKLDLDRQTDLEIRSLTCPNCGMIFSHPDEFNDPPKTEKKSQFVKDVEKFQDSLDARSKLPEVKKEETLGDIFAEMAPKEAEPDSEYKRGFTHGYEDGKRVARKKLIEDAIKDLDELVAWSNNYPKDSEIYIRIKRKREKWQGKQK